MPPDGASLTPAVFLDRDGTIIEDVHYLARPEQVRLIPGAAAAIRFLNGREVPVVVVTNQAGVARVYFPEERVGEVHVHLSNLLAAEGAVIDAYYHCPHHHAQGQGGYRIDCGCRKPKPGMLHAAAADHRLDLQRSWMIGDNITDLQAGAAAGCRTVLVRTGHGAKQPDPLPAGLRLAGVVADLAAAVGLWAAADTARAA